MERESFEDQDTADFMNEHFVSIKVDREERPDVDQIYMEACQALSGSGGWPLNCFLLPDGRPFYAGTYYPPMPAYNRPSWLQVLQHMYRAYRDQRTEVEQQATKLLDSIRSGNSIFIKEELLEQSDELIFNPVTAQNMTFQLGQRFDREDGGFGGAPKFPGAMSLSYLLDYHHFTGDEASLAHVHFSLDKMIGGGIYDQLGGGFARYATDKAWLVPHFEKMLYDNALLIDLIADTHRLEARPHYEDTIRETLAFVERELQSPEGVFYSALDADSEGEEGKFYVFSKKEIEAVLGDNAAMFSAAYGTSEAGNWEGTNILWRAEELAAVAKAFGLDEATLKKELSEAREKLFDYRSKRVRPGLDDKVILSWNALMISAYAKAYLALGDEHYRQVALKATDFLLTHMQASDGGMRHTYKEGRTQYPAFLDDYAFLIAALLDLYAITFEERYIDKAKTFTEFVLEHFLDRADNLFYFTSAQQEDLPLRRKEMYDSAMPSGNSTMILNLQRLALLTGKEEWDRLSIQQLKQMAESVEKYPTSFGRWAKAILYRAYPTREVAIVGDSAEKKALALQAGFWPNLVIMARIDGQDADYPLLAGKTGQEDAQIFVCRQYACQLPVNTIAEAEALL